MTTLPPIADAYTSAVRIINLAREDAKGVEAMGLKLMEEVGELAEAINFHQGYLPHKTMKEPLIGEAADVIQNVLAILSRVYEDKSPDEILGELEEHLQKKTDKWESIMVKAEVPQASAVSEMGTIVISHSVKMDHELNDKGLKFIGVGEDDNGSEIHLFVKP